MRLWAWKLMSSKGESKPRFLTFDLIVSNTTLSQGAEEPLTKNGP